MTVRQLRRLIRGGEGVNVEFKRSEIKPSDLAETLVAMANSQGGSVLIGVNDAGTVVGVASVKEAHDLVQIAAREVVQPAIEVSTVEVRLPSGAVVLVVRIDQIQGAVTSISGRFLVRRGSRNVPVTTDEIAHLLKSRGASTPFDFPYEILNHDLLLELHDARGKEATLHRRARVRFLHDQVLALRDRVWSEGETSPIVSVQPGFVVDEHRSNHQHHSLIALREPKRRGEISVIEIVHRIEDGFVHGREWFEVETELPTHRLRFEVRFPSSRPPRQAWLLEDVAGQRRALVGANWVKRGGQVSIVWRRRQPTLRERFRTEWVW